MCGSLLMVKLAPEGDALKSDTPSRAAAAPPLYVEVFFTPPVPLRESVLLALLARLLLADISDWVVEIVVGRPVGRGPRRF